MATNVLKYETVFATLDYLNYPEFKNEFVENELDDVYLEKCVCNSTIQSAISSVLKIGRRQHEFVCEFTNRVTKKLEELTSVDVFQQPDSSNTVEPNDSHEQCESSVDTATQDTNQLTDSEQEFIPPSKPQAIQIMDFDEKDFKQLPIVFYKQQLASILVKTGNRPVAIIVIAGAKRQGKSLYLNFILRHLQNLQCSESSPNGTQDDEPLVGFTWRTSYERVTRGMWMWSEPFTVRSKHDGSEFDILLVDTQGVFDEQTGSREWSILMGLSLLTSSCIIFNVMQNINENDLQILASFLSFGRLAMQDEHFSINERPFQKLVYLVRDFGNPDDFPYGSEGGKKFISKVLGTSEGFRPENNAVREKITECFNEISCILLPRPEDEVLSKGYNGSTGASKRFACEIRKSIAQLLDHDVIPTVKINGNNLTGHDILELFEVYVNLYNQSELVNPPSIYYATMQACNIAVANKCTTSFVKFIENKINEECFLTDEDLEKSYHEAYASSLHQFRSSSNLMGTQAAVNETENKLLKQLHLAFENLKSSNTAKRIEAQATMNAAIASTKEQYVNNMGCEIKNRILESTKMEKYHQKVFQKCMEDFAAVNSWSPLFPQACSKISEDMETEMVKFQQQIATARKIIDKEVEEILSLYCTKMQGATCVEKLGLIYPSAKSTALESIRNSENIPEKEKVTYCLQLEPKLTNIHAEMLQNFLITTNALQLEASIARAVKTAKKEYKKTMTACRNKSDDILTESQLEEAHGVSHSEATKYLQELLHHEIASQQISDDKFKSIVKDLNDSIQRCYDVFKENNIKKVNEAEENVNADIQKCVQLYLVMMETHLKGKLFSDQEILELHSNASKRCIDDFIKIHCNSAMLQNKQQDLTHKICTELENILKDMNTQIEQQNADASAQAATAESIYREEMTKLMEEDKESLEKFHSAHKLKALESLQPFKNHLNKEFIQQWSSNLEKQIEKDYEDLLNNKDKEEKQLIDSISEVQKKGVESYRENMTLFFKESDEYYPDQSLQDRHNHEKTEAKKLVKVFCNEIAKRTKSLGEEYQEIEILLAVSKSINDVFSRFQQQNDERKATLEQRIEEQVQKKVDFYKTSMNSRVNDKMSEVELSREHLAVQQECVELFTMDNSTVPMFTAFRETLLSKIEIVYLTFQDGLKIETEIKKANEDATLIYKIYAETILPQLDGSMTSANLDEEHNRKKNEAIDFLDKAHRAIKSESKIISEKKKSDQIQLSQTIEKYYAQLVQTNNNKRTQAEVYLKEQVLAFIQKYEAATATEIGTQLPSPKKIQETHQKIRSICLNEFSEKNKSSILIVQGREILVKRIDEKGENFKKQIKIKVDALKEKGKQLVAEGISKYRNKISQASLDNLEAFNTSHNIIQDFVLDPIAKAEHIPEDLRAEFLQNLKKEIKTEHDKRVEKHLHSKQEIEKGAKEAREAAQAQYYDNINKFCSITTEFIENSELQSQHKAEQGNAEQSFKNFFLKVARESRRSAAEQETKGLLELRKFIEQSFADFQKTNKANQVKSKERMDSDVIRFSKEYTSRMMSSFNEEIVLGTKFETIHESTFNAIMDEFSHSHSKSLLYKEGQEDLIKSIREEKDRLVNQMTTANKQMNDAGSSLVAQGLAAYTQEMHTVLGAETFESHHLKNKALQLDTIKNSKFLNKNYVDKFYNQLESEINAQHVELLGLHFQNKTKIMQKTIKAREDGKKKYETEMQALFTQDDKPIQESTLEAKHNLIKPEAISSLKNVYQCLKSKLKNYEAMEAAALSELEEHIDKHYLKVQETNKLLWTAFEAKAGNLSEVKAEYAKMLRKLQEAATNVEELEERDAALRLKVENSLSHKIDASIAKKDFLERVTEELKDYMAQHYDQTLVDFRLRLVRDETAVTAAFQKARQFYNEEMDKGFQAKQFFKPDELLKLSNGIAGTAIMKCKEEVGQLSKNQERQLSEAMKVVYTKYHDKNLKQYPCKDAAIGIDLGTTYSCVGVFLNGDVTIIPNREFNQSPTIASYVTFGNDHTIVVGDAAKAQASRYPVDTIFDAKRLIGRSINDEIVQNDIKLWPFLVVDEDGLAKVKVQGKVFHPEQISAKLLAKMKANAEDFLNQPVTKAVVTVPAYFSDAQRQATKDAAEIAGLTASILNEPTAAAIAYNLNCKDELRQRNVLIFDLGGGTFDVAVLQIKGNDIQVKATGGDTHLGGEDFDNRMVEEMIRRVKEKHDIDLARGHDSDELLEKANSSERLRRLRDSCEGAKRLLGSLTSYEIYVDRLDGDFGLKEIITREEFENLNKDLFEKCIETVLTTLKQAQIDKEKIDDIVLVGGSTRIPKVQQMLKDLFNQKIFCTSINPDEAVARGAAIHAAVLNGKQAANIGNGFKLSDVTPFSIGVKELSGAMSVMINKNTRVPCEIIRTYHIAEDYLTHLDVEVYEGENPIAKENNFLGQFAVDGIPANKAGIEKVKCKMSIDSDGILHVTVTSCSTGSAGQISIKTHKGRMTKAQIDLAKKEDLFKW